MNNQEISRVDVYPLDVPLLAPFGISSSSVEKVRNVAVRITLADGSEGWGETPTLPPVTVEDQPVALAALAQEAELLVGRNAGDWRRIAGELAERRADLAAVRAGIEVALIDAFACSCRVPLFRFFGGYDNSIMTDITIPITTAGEARELAAKYRVLGFETIKVKVGRDIAADLDRVFAIRRGHPSCRLVLDANAAYSVEEVFYVLRELERGGVVPALLEQPVPREDWEGLGCLAREAGVPVAADESCRNAEDALRIVRDRLAQVINIKLAKCGVVEVMQITAIARAGRIGLMIGGMVETRLAMGFSAHFAAGSGGFEWIDLDTPLLLAEDPIAGGYQASGPRYFLRNDIPGHGGSLIDRYRELR
jgi:L-alanine-DL-glutamate epimerase-like enolase superfamily enzyme